MRKSEKRKANTPEMNAWARLWNLVLLKVTPIKTLIRMFNRRSAHSKLSFRKHRQMDRRMKRDKRGAVVRRGVFSTIVYCTSSLALKRQLDGRHTTARQYKKLFKGICGALTYKDFNRAHTDKKGRAVILGGPGRGPDGNQKIFQPNTPRIVTSPVAKYSRPRSVRRLNFPKFGSAALNYSQLKETP